MTEVSADDVPERVPLNVRVSKSTWDKFNEAVLKKYGSGRQYAGVELERELRLVLDSGTVARLWSVVDELLSTLGIPTGAKNSQREFQRDADTQVIRCEVTDELREELMAEADRRERTAGEMVEAAMQRYCHSEGSVVDRVVTRLKRATTVGDELDTDKSATERRRDTIAAAVAGDDRTGFTLGEFDDAVDEHVHGLSSSSYARDEHLVPVLERIEYTWHPNNPDIFIPREEFDLPADDADRDPRGRPAVLTDAEHMTLAVAVEAAERAFNSGQGYRLTLGEAAGVVGKPDYNGLKGAFRRAAGRFDGLKPKERDGSFALGANPSDIREAADDDLLRHVDIDDDADDAAEEVREEMDRLEAAERADGDDTDDTGDTLTDTDNDAEPDGDTDDTPTDTADTDGDDIEELLKRTAAKVTQQEAPLEAVQDDEIVRKCGAQAEHPDAFGHRPLERIKPHQKVEFSDEQCVRVREHVNEMVGGTESATDADSDGRAVADGGEVVADE